MNPRKHPAILALTLTSFALILNPGDSLWGQEQSGWNAFSSLHSPKWLNSENALVPVQRGRVQTVPGKDEQWVNSGNQRELSAERLEGKVVLRSPEAREAESTSETSSQEEQTDSKAGQAEETRKADVFARLQAELDRLREEGIWQDAARSPRAERRPSVEVPAPAGAPEVNKSELRVVRSPKAEIPVAVLPNGARIAVEKSDNKVRLIPVSQAKLEEFTWARREFPESEGP